MSRKSIQPVIKAFLERRYCKVSNTETDGNNLTVFGNLIAYHKGNNIYISSAGWRTVTTKDRLNGLPGVSIYQKQGSWYLNGKYWDGKWTPVKKTFDLYVNLCKQ